MRTRYDELVARLREAALPERGAPDELAAYLEKVRHHTYRVTDAEVEALRARFSDDELFEHTVSVAVACGLERLDAALEALR